MTTLLRYSDLKARRIVDNWPRIRRLQEQSGFPQGFLLGPQTRVWDEAEVEAWLDKRRLVTTLSDEDGGA
jgi:hypothetical protein